MIQTVEREATNNLIVKMLTDGKLHKEIANELGIGVGRVCDIAKANNLERRPREATSEVVGGTSLEDIRKANPYKVRDKVIVRDKNGSDTYKSYNCVVECITDNIVFARGDNGRMYTATFGEIGIKADKGAELIRRRG